MSWEVVSGDCLDALAKMPESSVDAVVTDPPYGLSAEPDAAEVLRHWLNGDDYQHRGGGFMGKTWDSFVPGPKVWAECHRVLKPGGHLVAFFGTRTYDLGAMAIRLAGFEVRDCLAWMYGSGFPKSLDVSKAIDKAAGAEREVVGRKKAGMGSGATFGMLQAEGLNHQAEPVIPVTVPATPAAQKWQGWGTALKPAFEPIILARKPLTGTVAANVQEFGTGALNVDGGRVGTEDRFGGGANATSGFVTGYENGDGWQPGNPAGRWPANVILDPEAGALLDEMSGESVSRSGNRGLQYSGRHGGLAQGPADLKAGTDGTRGHDDSGGASRFFYCPKASRAERNAGLDGMPRKKGGIKNDSGRGFSESDPYAEILVANHHPTVKPIDLMRYLCRLVTPPGGTVLDPFTGSGTTGIAAGLEGFDFVGVEREAEYREIAEARLKWWADREGETDEILRRAGLAEKERERAEAVGQVSLFDEAA